MNLRNDENGSRGGGSPRALDPPAACPTRPWCRDSLSRMCRPAALSAPCPGFAATATVTGCDALPPLRRLRSRPHPGRPLPADAPGRSDPHGDPPSCRDRVRSDAHL